MPKYQALYDRLRMAILRGEYAPDERLPSENALAIRFGLSRITTKRALNELAEADLVYRKQGKGTFVKPHASTASRELLLVVPFTDPAAFGDYQTGIETTLKGTTWVLNLRTNQQFAQTSASELLKRYAGIIYYPQQLPSELPLLLTLFTHQLPLVMLDKAPAHFALPSIESDNVLGGQLAVAHLRALGHTRIAFLADTPFWQDFTGTVADRFCGYVNGYRGVSDGDPLAWAQNLASCPNAAAKAHYLRENKITALIAENDLTALALMRELQVADADLAAKLSVIGFDDLPLAAASDPPLTSLAQDFKQLGAEAVAALLAQINEPAKLFPPRRPVPVTLMQRASTIDRPPF